MITGGCLCGAVRYEVDADRLEHASYCHCTMCRRASGSAFGVSARAPAAKLRWTGREPKCYRSSKIAVRAFCPDCGSPIYFQYDARPHYYAVAVGSLDDPGAVKPELHYGIESHIPWVNIDDGLPRRETSS
ncbi:MAG TPA: GFA family protein [Alphaproteobacteria bacterium]|jgi:hypothetical protein